MVKFLVTVALITALPPLACNGQGACDSGYAGGHRGAHLAISNPVPDQGPQGQVKATSAADKSTTNSIGMKLVLIPAGTFSMGSRESSEETAKAFNYSVDETYLFEIEHPIHQVRITKAFYIGAYHVTVGQFRKFVHETGYKTDAESGVQVSEFGRGGIGFTADVGMPIGVEYNWHNPGFEQTDAYPVVEVSWNDAVAFCGWLSRKERKTYRLPTEAEWEYACRAGTNTRYSNGDNPEKLVDVGNIADKLFTDKFPSWNWDGTFTRLALSAKDGYAMVAPVGQFKPNPWGLYDMHGNVWQWCADGCGCYHASPVDDPVSPSSPGWRACRGGSWADLPAYARSAARSERLLNVGTYSTGFRVAMTP